ncbi:MAG: glycosyl transferase [Spirochaetaceae bacterium]|nr:glycosyl transferase [Spirochaetaceae bacterium]
MIPKIIHYCWLSNDPIPADYQRCMATWKEKLPDYEFMLWDAARFDMNSVLWVKQAFDVKLYACAADYIRLYAVYSHGGIYLDMDMEVVKPFGELLNANTMLAYENHIGHNVEAGCFGAEINNPYIKKCMDYFEETPFFDPALLPKVLDLPQSKRHKFIDPLILPEIMKDAAEKYFSADELHFYPPDYFTAKNIVTGKIEATDNTFTIHHFAAQYHSEEWRKNRIAEQSIRASFGEKTKLSKIILVIRGAAQRVKRYGFFTAARYYIDRFILHKRSWEGLDF